MVQFKKVSVFSKRNLVSFQVRLPNEALILPVKATESLFWIFFDGEYPVQNFRLFWKI
jgi:hypothetical protein